MIPRFCASLMRRPRHHTLIFHRVLEQSDPMSPSEPTAAWFRQLVRTLASNFELISLHDALDRASSGVLSGRTISITFDDGYADNYRVALPILAECSAPATFFVASGFMDGGRMWNDTIIETFRRLNDGPHEVDMSGGTVFELSDWASRRQAAAAVITAWKHLPPVERQARVDQFAQRADDLPTDLMMSTQELRRLAATPGVSIGGHTRSHPILAALAVAEARDEIERGKHDLESIVQHELTLFAYPNGRYGRDYRAEHAELARQAGFTAAVATDWGTLDATTDRFSIPRFTPWQRNLNRFSLDLARCHYGLL